MKLHPPFEISSRLMPAVRVGGAFLSLDCGGNFPPDGRICYRIWVDLPDGTEYEITDLRSGVGGGSVQEGMGALLSFLGAAAESRQYRERTGRDGENEDLFPAPVVDWASEHSDEIDMLGYEIEETPDLVTD